MASGAGFERERVRLVNAMMYFPSVTNCVNQSVRGQIARAWGRIRVRTWGYEGVFGRIMWQDDKDLFDAIPRRAVHNRQSLPFVWC